MILNNLRVTITAAHDTAVELVTDQGATISLPRHLMGEVKTGDVLYISIDSKPLVAADQHAKDVLNEIIGDGEGK